MQLGFIKEHSKFKYLKMQKLISTTAAICLMLFIFSCNNENSGNTAKTETTQTTETKPVTEAPLNGDYCFMHAENNDTTTVRLRILSDDDIRGEMIWNPWQKDGAVGTLTGKLISKNEMELKYEYVIEGNKQTETQIMKIEGDKLHIKSGELIDPKNDGNLVFKDASKAEYKDVLKKTSCE